MKTLKEKQVAYRQVFGNPVGKEVIKDLNKFCYGTKTTAGRPESLERLEGRREVLLQIMSVMKIDFQDLFDEYLDEDF